MVAWQLKPITRKLNGAKLEAADDQPSPQIRELERKNHHLIERVKELQAENDTLNWWIGKFADQQREAITAAGIQLRIATARNPGIYAK